MSILLRLLSIFAACILLCICASLIPMKNIPSKMVSASKINPLSISDYGYIDILSWQYVVKNFSYILKIGDDTYVLLKAKKFGTGITQTAKAALSGCEIYTITSRSQSEVGKLLSGNIQSAGDINISGWDCKVDIRIVEKSVVDKVAQLQRAIKEDDILSIEPDIALYANDVDFQLQRTALIHHYFAKGLLNNEPFELNANIDAMGQGVEFAFGGTKTFYKSQQDGDVKIVLDSSDIGEFMTNFLCNSPTCQKYAWKLGGKLKLEAEYSHISNTWQGKIDGIAKGKISTNQDKATEIFLDMVELNIKTDTREEDFDDLADASIYALSKNLLNLNQNITVNIAKATLGKNIFEEMRLQYNSVQKTLDIEGKYNHSNIIKTKQNTLKDLQITASDVVFADVVALLDAKDSMFTKGSSDLRGEALFQVKTEDDITYLARVDFLTPKHGKFSLRRDACIKDCYIGLDISGIQLWELFNRKSVLMMLGMESVINPEKLAMKQSALLYTQSDDEITANGRKKIEINFDNIRLNESEVISADVTYETAKDNTLVRMKNIKSDIISGDFSMQSKTSSDISSTLLLNIDIKKVDAQRLLGIFYPSARIEDTNFVIPSLAGFDGKIEVAIDDAGALKNVNFKGNISNGIVTLSQSKLQYSGIGVALNGSIGLASKPEFNVGIAVPKASLYDILGKRAAIDGILSINGNLLSSGFNFTDMKKNLSGQVRGNIYNLKIDNCNMQRLSNSLISYNKINNLDVMKTLSSGAITFPSANVIATLENSKISSSLTNASTTGTAMSGACTLEFNSHKVSDCKAIFNIIAADPSRQMKFTNLQVSWGGVGTLESLASQFNYSQISQYKEAILKQR